MSSQEDQLIEAAINEIKKLPCPFKMDKIATYVGILELLMRNSRPKIAGASTVPYITNMKSFERNEYFDNIREQKDTTFVLPDEVKEWFFNNHTYEGLYNHKITDNRICKVADHYYVNNSYRWVRYTNVYMAVFAAAFSANL